MLSCFVCKEANNNPESLFSHIKKSHRMKDISVFQCTVNHLCWAKFSNFSTYKRHVLRCIVRMDTNEEMPEEIPEGILEGIPEEIIDPEMYIYSIDSDVLEFGEELSKAALELVCDLCGNMSSPRCETYKTVARFKKTYLPKIISGIKKVIIPRLRPEEEETVNHFINAIQSSFDHVSSEDKLDSRLKELDFICPLTKCEIFETVKEKKKKPRRKARKEDTASKEVLDVDGAVSRKRGHEMEDSERESAMKGVVTVMPITFQIKKFFELPNVFEKVQRNTRNIQEGNVLNHFIKGRLWKEKTKNFKPDQFVIPYHFYGDGAQMNAALGPHAKPGEEQCNYYYFPTIPYEYQSRLDNIFVAQLYPAMYHQHFTTEQLYNNIIEIFRTLAEDGVTLNINNEEFQVYFVLGLFTGDNKEQNNTLGFVKAFVGNHPCRYCRMILADVRTKVNSVGATRRNRENYDADVATDNVTSTGVDESSPFNSIPYFHVTESSSIDITHDLTEGSQHISFSKSILHFIDKEYFDLEYLNHRMISMDFGEAENGNVPIPITEDRLKLFKFRMWSSEMFFFIHHFTLMVGDRVPENDPVWQHILTAIKFFDLCYLPSYDQEELDALRSENEKFNQELKDLFDQVLPHKCHLGTHYADLTEDFGPFRYVQSLRPEGKHKEMKNYLKNTNSRKNPSFSLGRKIQYQFAIRLLRGEGLEDRISIPNYTNGSIDNKVYYSRLPPSTMLNEILSKECFFAKTVTLNGIIFSVGLWLPDFINNDRRIYEIIDILALELNDITKIFAVCKLYTLITYEKHYECYGVNLSSLQGELEVVNLNEFLVKNHQYPVKIQMIGNKNLFRCKRF